MVNSPCVQIGSGIGLDEVEELQLALLQAIQIYEAFHQMQPIWSEICG